MKKIISTLFVAFISLSLFAQGYYVEMKMTSDQKGFSGAIKMYYQDGNSRSETVMSIPGMPGGSGINVTTLVLSSNPKTSYMLNEKDKTYTETTFGSSDDDWKDYPQSDYEITVLGKESVNGYNSTHVNVKRKGSKEIEEMWTSTEMVDYADYAKIKSKYTGKDNLFKALEAKGAGGFPVRIKTQEHGSSIQIDMVKVEKKTISASLFSLDGYKKSSGTNGMPAGIDMQEIMKNAQNMTPEQMEQLKKQMEDQYKPH